jgi:hypothetical protein
MKKPALNSMYISLLIGAAFCFFYTFIQCDNYRSHTRILSINEVKLTDFLTGIFFGTMIGYIFYIRIRP